MTVTVTVYVCMYVCIRIHITLRFKYLTNKCMYVWMDALTEVGTEGKHCEVRKRVWGHEGKTAGSENGIVNNVVHER